MWGGTVWSRWLCIVSMNTSRRCRAQAMSNKLSKMKEEKNVKVLQVGDFSFFFFFFFHESKRRYVGSRIIPHWYNLL